ncbi:hypothetical protein [Actinomyces vulturis]|uniref:hypothetical protein n=1 Tax=Actinomyces vulturis TaxID=1857645 RepID=UPI0008349157|nr:hypothetical protein [Actinomyces vulturis]
MTIQKYTLDETKKQYEKLYASLIQHYGSEEKMLAVRRSYYWDDQEYEWFTQLSDWEYLSDAQTRH